MPNTAEVLKDRFFQAVVSGDAATVKRILHDYPVATKWVHGLDPRDNGSYYLPRTLPLHAAVIYGRPDIIALLLEAKADINAQSADRTALHVGVGLGNMEPVKLLLERRADPNIGDAFLTPLMTAADNANNGLVELLIDNGARVNDTGKNNWTALHFAALKGKQETVALLLERNADAAAKIDSGQTPAQLANPALKLWIRQWVEARDMKLRQEKGVALLSAAFGHGAGKPVAAPEPAAFRRKTVARGPEA